MKAYLENLESEYYHELTLLLESKQNTVRSALDLSQRYLGNLKMEIIEKGFKKSQDEITCFKIVKPKLHAEVLYYRGLLMTQKNLPIASDEIKINYLTNHLARFHVFFEENKEFISYSRSEFTFLDDHFFIRQNAQVHRTFEIDFSEVDFRWSTGYDVVLAKCIAFEKLEFQIKQEMLRILRTEGATFDPIIAPGNPKKGLHWTDSKTSLVELIYALHSSGVINNGQADIKTITEVLQQVFHLELGDHYKIYHELKARKINRTKFLNNLIETLNRRMEADDE